MKLEAIATENGGSSPWVLLQVSRNHMALLSVSSSDFKVVKDLPKVSIFAFELVILLCLRNHLTFMKLFFNNDLARLSFSPYFYKSG